MTKLAIEVFSMGELLTDASTAYLKQGVPSAFLKRLTAAVDRFMSDEANSLDDRAFIAPLQDELRTLSDAWVQREISHFTR